MCYAVLRTSVELFRGDAERGTIHGLIPSIPLGVWYNISTSQFISLAMFSFGAYLLVKNLREVRAQPQVDVSALTTA
jgi:phosphatidylglycerol:prolipoprotein diacylglycerol transferase